MYLANEIEFFMDEISEFYDNICTPCSENRVAYLVQLLSEIALPHPLFLDISCSTGETIYRLSKECKGEFYGSDFSNGMIKVAKEKNRNSINNHFCKVDMQELANGILPMQDVVYGNSMEWLPSYNDLENVLSNISKILKPNGYLILDIVNRIKFQKKIKAYYSSYVSKGDWLYIKNTYYRRQMDKYIINQIYHKVSLGNGEMETVAGEFHYTPIDLGYLKKIINKQYRIVGIEKNYGFCGNDHYQIICKKQV